MTRHRCVFAGRSLICGTSACDLAGGQVLSDLRGQGDLAYVGSKEESQSLDSLPPHCEAPLTIKYHPPAVQ